MDTQKKTQLQIDRDAWQRDRERYRAAQPASAVAAPPAGSVAATLAPKPEEIGPLEAEAKLQIESFKRRLRDDARSNEVHKLPAHIVYG